MDSVDCNQFDKRTAQLEEKWNRIAPGFHVWFLRQKVEVFKKSMIAPIREAAQLGSPPKNYTDNANESANFVLKDWVDFSKNNIPTFIAELRSFTQQNLAEAEQAVYGAGEFCLAEDFKYLEACKNRNILNILVQFVETPHIFMFILKYCNRRLPL